MGKADQLHMLRSAAPSPRTAPAAVRLAELPGDDVKAAAALAQLAGVPADAMRALLALHWRGDDEARAVDRLRDYRNTSALRAAALRALQPPRQASIPALVDLLVAERRWSKRKAFEHLAELRHVDRDSIRNAYYLLRDHDDAMS